MAQKTRLTYVFVGMVLLTASMAGTPASADRAGVPYRLVSTDPYTNTDAFHESAVGPSMLANGSTVVTAFQLGRFPASGATNIGFATSNDGGRTWASGTLPATTSYADPPGPYEWVSQPSVGYSAKQHEWLISGVGQGTQRDIFVSRSTDGMTWDDPLVVSVPNPFFGYESPQIACDSWPSSPYFGNCYLKWDALYDLYAAVSNDGGLTWRTSNLPLNSEGFGGSIAVQPSGGLIMALGDEYSEICCTYTSHDGGRSYRFYALHPGLREHKVNGNLRAYNFGSLAVDDGG